MARYIDADKVMEEIASMGGHDLCEWSTLGVKVLINRQPTADVAPRAEWISVEERVPNGSGKFLVVDEEGYMTTATWYPNYGWFMAVCNGTPVTHWMPLPEPPKGDHHE